MEKLIIFSKKNKLNITIFTSFSIPLVLMIILFYPMRMPAPVIKNYVLRRTPIGMCINDVIKVIENNNRWGYPSVNRSSGFNHPSRFILKPDGSPIAATIGAQSIQTRVLIDNFNLVPFHRRIIRIWWGFDENEKLIEVYVRSTFSPRLQ